MKLNLREVPFSCRGSYMVISYLKGEFNYQKVEEGLYLRTVHGAAATSFAARILTKNGKPYSYEAVPEELRLWNEEGECRIAFADDSTVLMTGNLQLELDFSLDELNKGISFTFGQPVRVKGRDFCLLNCFDNSCRYMLRAQQGGMQLRQKWTGNRAEHCRVEVEPDRSGQYLITIEENYDDWADRGTDFDFGQAVKKNHDAFQKFFSSMPAVPAEYQDAAEVAAYVDWVSFVKPCGLLEREAMLMSKNWMCSVWSWDHCFNALALAYGNPKESWDQFLLMFDYQNASGSIPDCVNDSRAVHNFCKPPIHGWTLRKLMKILDLSEAQLREAYDKVSGWTGWWLQNRDSNGDGLCEYMHGNDSGWDNSTVFREGPVVTSPDLAGFLIVQMDVLSELAERLNEDDKARVWKQRSEDMLEKLTARLFENGLPIAFSGLENSRVETDSLILFLPVILGKKLPEAVRNKMVEVLKSDKFYTEFGFATESPGSSEYEDDGYWRGPIWAPSTMLILDGLWECGEKEFVKSTARKYCRMIQASGCAENFDALTGEGLRDHAYTWTASVMLVIAHEYLLQFPA